MNCTELIDRYEAHLRALRRFQKAGKDTSAWQFLRPLLLGWKQAFGHLEVSQLARPHIVCYRDDQEIAVAQFKCLPCTANRRLAKLREWLLWGVARGFLNESLDFTLPKIKAKDHADVVIARTHPKRAVSWDDVRAVAAQSHQMYADMLLLQRTVGCRPGELCSMRLEDLDRTRGDGWWAWQLKTHKTIHHDPKIRVTYWLDEECQKLLANYVAMAEADHAQFVFRPRIVGSRIALDPDGPVLISNYLAATIAGCERAGVPRFTPHELRHAVATERANSPAISMAAASRSLGHRRLSSLQSYVHDDQEQLQAAARIR